MKAIEFKKIIREAIKDELKQTLPSILKEFFSSGKNTNIDEDDDLEYKASFLGSNINERINPKEKLYVKDPILNKVLNQTKVKIDDDSSMGDYDISEEIRESFINNLNNDIPIKTKPKIVDDNNPLAKVLNRDFSKLLKVADDKAKQNRI